MRLLNMLQKTKIYVKSSKIFHKMRIKAECKAKRLKYFTSLTEGMSDVASFFSVFVINFSTLFGRFQLSEFASGWRARRSVRAAL
jgi:hypothetical protein